MRCMPECVIGNCFTMAPLGIVGECTMLQTTEGEAQTLCLVQRAEGGYCELPQDCQSGKCVQNRCGPVDGAPNGGTCVANQDCRSNQCVVGSCRGVALIGDACTGSADCAAGVCCPSGASPQTCQVACN